MTQKDVFSSLIGILIVRKIQSYLVLLTQIGYSKNQCFNFLVDQTRNKLQARKAKFLSFSSRTTLNKAVAQAILTYMTSLF